MSHSKKPATSDGNSRSPAARASTLKLEPERSASDDEQHVIDAIRDLAWGRIENLVIRGGVPRVTKDTKLLQRVRAERKAKPAKVRRAHAQHEKLLADCRRMRDGVMARIEVADGLPIVWKPGQPRSKSHT